MKLTILNIDEIIFPNPELALQDPDGLLCLGGDLSSRRLIKAYSNGIFPWFSDGDPIMWWSPDPRAVLFLDKLHVSKSLSKCIRKNKFNVTWDKAFGDVISNCSKSPRKNQDGTWITADMQEAYIRLHELGVAHSVESWKNGVLVGGLYGVAIGKVFFGESMFSLASNASKVALVFLVKKLLKDGFVMIDCQQETNHILSMGAEVIPRSKFLNILSKNTGSNLC